MIDVPLLADWAVRSSILILCGALLLRALRVKDSSVRLAAWTAMLGGSLLIPALTAALPKLPLSTNWLAMRAALTHPVEVPIIVNQGTPDPVGTVSGRSESPVGYGSSDSERAGADSNVFEWPVAAAWVYLVVTVTLLLRLFMGLAMSLRLLRSSCVTGQATEGIQIRESGRVEAPVTLGIVRPAIVLPVDWREWEGSKLDAVLAHERSHIRRRDPALQMLSLIHRALLWHSPLGWFLHKRLVQAAEEASDDAAVAATRDRISYAEVLLDFMRRGTKRPNWRRADCDGVAMARYGVPEKRIHRILDGTTVSRGVTRWSLAAILALGSPLAYVVATAQTRAEFEIADVHVSPSPTGGRDIVQMEGGDAVRGGRYEIHNATMVELIGTAYSVRADAVLGGPNWLALDRFNVIAKAPDQATPASLNLMLQSLLAARFKLVVRDETRLMPAWVLSKGTGNPRLRRPDNSNESGCRPDYERDRLSCRNVTLDAFVAWLRAGPNTVLPVVNSTGIEASWDFDLDGLRLNSSRGVSQNNPILDPVDSQLGLKLALQDIPQPVLVVESVNRTPTANAADVEQRLPPDPIEFEVASIRPCQAVDPRTTGGDIGQRISPSGQLTTGCRSLATHVATAWNLGTDFRISANRVLGGGGSNNIQGAPSWLNSRYFNIAAKAPIPIAGALARDPKYRTMLRNLLVDRFKIVAHYEDRLVDVYTLVAEKPKLRQAEPSSRSGCTSTGLVPGSAQGYSSVVTCQNATMAQFAEELSHTLAIASTGRRMVDETGIQGTWDVTLTYRYMLGAVTAPGVAADPAGVTVSVEEAVQQLGLKLERAKRPMPVFVIDHIEENPTEN